MTVPFSRAAKLAAMEDAHRFREKRAGGVHRALPAWTLLFVFKQGKQDSLLASGKQFARRFDTRAIQEDGNR